MCPPCVNQLGSRVAPTRAPPTFQTNPANLITQPPLSLIVIMSLVAPVIVVVEQRGEPDHQYPQADDRYLVVHVLFS